ncbi:type I-F CRISPR-associated protein Csy1 [Salinivibrio sp. ML198]|uniref:type I-F CRISPR-associated protein Csy1 n=1 Tax=unclassified Salinivibrio TaxID=2636825 RepID=UPI00098437B0|nr:MULTISPECIES: type I-F CRISPR-associated protein Csy1 [unclassified Salinivibrio]OOE69436.1 type I-F CRISPR-associated protein Csy1 [Salinivibrio sp. IB868]OOE76632.1 type I-F CRISPR-associated protein Csy1 [Salinivibrio sp. IB870]OOE82085.1 type I-F CRISPR-associated protein Csy1 [Salinivibrio sp. ML198]
MEHRLYDALLAYIEQRKQAKLEPLQKARDKALKAAASQEQEAIANADYAEKAAPIEAKFEPIHWITDAATRAKQISLATHCPKFTHGDAKATSMLVTEVDKSESRYLTSYSLTDKAIDADCNAAVLDVARFLKVTVEGESLISQLQAGHINALKPLIDDATLLETWRAGFSLALNDQTLSAHNLTKQTYFPVNEGEYLLLCPLYSSSLAHALYNKVRATRFGEKVKAIREAKNKQYYHPERWEIFPHTVKQAFGGTNKQNISLLNSNRQGEGFLLNAAPPSYQQQPEDPSKQTSIFNLRLAYQASHLLHDFRAFLASLTERDRNFATRYRRDHDFILPLTDLVFDYAARVQQQVPAGWSQGTDDQACRLKREHAIWLDVHNPDDQFQRERDAQAWLDTVASDFAAWLLRQLEDKQHYLLGDTEFNYIRKVFLTQLKAFERDTPQFEENR